jgi:hypothetical protein
MERDDMINTRSTKVHFILLAFGTVIYLISNPGMLTHNQSAGTYEANVTDIAALCQMTIFYIAFVFMVFGHALLWRSPADHSIID